MVQAVGTNPTPIMQLKFLEIRNTGSELGGFVIAVRRGATMRITFEHPRFMVVFVHEGGGMASKWSYNYWSISQCGWKSTDCQTGIPIDIHRYSTPPCRSNGLCGYLRIFCYGRKPFEDFLRKSSKTSSGCFPGPHWWQRWAMCCKPSNSCARIIKN